MSGGVLALHLQEDFHPATTTPALSETQAFAFIEDTNSVFASSSWGGASVVTLSELYHRTRRPWTGLPWIQT